jgi:hypothetical protein
MGSAYPTTRAPTSPPFWDSRKAYSLLASSETLRRLTLRLTLWITQRGRPDVAGQWRRKIEGHLRCAKHGGGRSCIASNAGCECGFVDRGLERTLQSSHPCGVVMDAGLSVSMGAGLERRRKKSPRRAATRCRSSQSRASCSVS